MIKQLIPNLIKQLYLKRKFTIGKKVAFYKGVEISRNSFFEGSNVLYNNVKFIESCLGLGSYIASNSIIKNAKIGRFCSIGENVRTCLGMHPSEKFVSTHPAFFSLGKQSGFTFTNVQLFKEHKYIDDDEKYVCSIGNDVWIGNNVLIMDGVTVGDGSIIAAGAIVTKNIKPYEIVGGIPAKLIKMRFSEDQISLLLKIRWWDWDLKKLQTHSNNFVDVESFIKAFSK